MRCLLPVKMRRLFCVHLFILFRLTSQAQETNPVAEAIAKAPNDSVRVLLLSHQSENAADGVWEGYTVQLKELTEKKLSEEKTPRLRKFYAKYLALALNNLGLDASNKGNYNNAEDYWKESQKMARQAGEPSQEATALSNLCRQYYNSGQLEKAFDGFHQALKIYRSRDERGRIATTLNYLGDIYRTQNDLPNAAKSYTEALQILEAINDKLRLADSYNRLGMVATMENDEDAALTHFTKALDIYEQKGLKRGEINIQFQLGKLKARMKKWNETLPYYYKTLALLKKTEQNYIRINCMASIGQAYFFLKKPDSAIYYLNQFILLDKDFKYPDLIVESTKLLYLLYREKGDMTIAMEMYELYFKVKDSLFNDNSRKAVLKSQSKYEYDKKALLDSLKIQTEKNEMEARLAREKNQRLKTEIEKNVAEARRLKTETENNVLEASLIQEKNQRIKLSTEKNVEEARRLKTETEKNILTANLIQEKNQRYGLLGGLVLVVMTAGFGFSQYRTRQRLKELKLRNQIASDLHDEVGSAISSISLFAGMARMKQGGNTEALVEKIEETSRETINTMSDIVWSIEPANDSFQNVLRKMKQFGEQLTAPLTIDFTFTTEPGIDKLSPDMKQRKNIYLVYKEAVNNSCKHGQPTAIMVTLRKKTGALVMTIADNGRGFDVNQQHSGYGTGSMKARTADLNGQLEIRSSAETGTSVTLTLPL